MKHRSRQKSFTLLKMILLFAIFDLFKPYGDLFHVDARPVTLFLTQTAQLCARERAIAKGREEEKSMRISAFNFKDRPMSKMGLSIDLSNLSPIRIVSSQSSQQSFKCCDNLGPKGDDIPPMVDLPSRPMPTEEVVEEDEDLTLQRRGGKGMSRHLFAGAAAATMASATATLGIFSNSLKAHDQDKYGVSKKTGLQDKTKDKGIDGKNTFNSDNSKNDKGGAGGRKDDDDDDDDDDGPGSPTYINNITYVNNIYLNASPVGNTRRDVEAEDGSQKIPMETMTLSKRGMPASAPKAKGWHRYDRLAPIAEKIEDYGKMSAAAGALTAAIVMSYSALKAHHAYQAKAQKGKDDDEKEKKKKNHQRRNLFSSIEDENSSNKTGLVPLIYPSNSSGMSESRGGVVL